MRFTLFTLLLTSAVGEKSWNYLKNRDLLKCPTEMNSKCVVEGLRQDRLDDLKLQWGVPKEKDVTPRKIASSDLMDSYGSLHDQFRLHKDNGKVSRSGDHTGKIVIPIILTLKVLGLLGVLALQHFLLKAALLAKLSLIISGFLIFRAMSHSLKKHSSFLLPAVPMQYPKYEPDLSGYDYTSLDGYHYNERDLILAALNKTLMSRPGNKWRITLSD